MASEEDREKHSRKRKRSLLEKKDRSENKGAFSFKPKNPKKEEYKREKLDLRKLETGTEE